MPNEADLTQMQHHLRRTSPTGPGQPFIGTCVQCGKEGVTLSQFIAETCPNPRGVTQGESLLLAVSEG